MTRVVRPTSLQVAQRSVLEPVTVLIVDDCPAARDGIRSILKTHADIRVVGEAEDALSGLEQALRLKPRIVLMDFQMAGTDVAEATRLVKESSPGTKVLGMLVHSAHIAPALAAGADGYLMKDAGRRELCRKILETAGGF